MTEDNTKALKLKISQVLTRSSSILFPLDSGKIKKLLKPHNWRDRNYVGEAGGKVCAWSGFSINLAYLDSRYRGLFGDYVGSIPVKN